MRYTVHRRKMRTVFSPEPVRKMLLFSDPPHEFLHLPHEPCPALLDNWSVAWSTANVLPHGRFYLPAHFPLHYSVTSRLPPLWESGSWQENGVLFRKVKDPVLFCTYLRDYLGVLPSIRPVYYSVGVPLPKSSSGNVWRRTVSELSSDSMEATPHCDASAALLDKCD